jgi:hypothetical protein
MFEDKKICVLVDRSQSMYLLPLNIGRSMYRGTILDGELVQCHDGTWVYAIYDCILIENNAIKQVNLTTRLVEASRFVSSIMKMAKDPLTMFVKSMYDSAPELMDKTFPYETDGIVFTPVNEPVRSGTHETMFKWKPRDKNTIDFQFKWDARKKKWNMFIQEKGKLIIESELFESQVGDFTFSEDDIVECQYIHWESPRWWKPLQKRTDKTYPNNRRTFYRTLHNIAENIQLSEFTNPGKYCEK